jgi:hypothetical protein
MAHQRLQVPLTLLFSGHFMMGNHGSFYSAEWCLRLLLERLSLSLVSPISRNICPHFCRLQTLYQCLTASETFCFQKYWKLCANSEVLGIGVIFARIIDAFPPTEEEVHQKISQLLGVGELSLQNFVL